MSVFTLWQLVWVISHCNGIIRPRKRRETHLILSHEDSTIEGIAAIIACKREPTSILMVTRILWFREGNELILNVLLLIDANHLTRLTVWIVVNCTTTIVIQQSECLWNTYCIAQLSECQIRLIACNCALALNATIREDSVNHLCIKAEIVLTEWLFLVLDELLPVGIATLKAITIRCL